MSIREQSGDRGVYGVQRMAARRNAMRQGQSLAGPLSAIAGAWMITGCVSPAMDLVTFAHSVGIDKPYAGARRYSGDPDTLCSALLNALAKRGAQIIACDTDAGLVAWCDSGGTFNVMPSKVKRTPAPPSRALLPSVARWRGIVYGAARLRATASGTWLYLHATSRDVDAATVFASDGTYERLLFKDVTTAMDRDTQASRPSRPAGKTVSSRSTTAIGETLPKTTQDYADLYFTHFRRLASPKIKEVRRAGRMQVYPVPLSDFWDACVDVIWQYDSVAEVSSAQSRIVFAHGMSLPTGGARGEDKFQYVDVLVVLYAEPRGQSGTNLFLAWLPPGRLTAQAIPELTSKQERDLQAMAKEKLREVAAAFIAEQFLSQVSTQLLYSSRWGDKLSRRRLSKDVDAKDARRRATHLRKP